MDTIQAKQERWNFSLWEMAPATQRNGNVWGSVCIQVEGSYSSRITGVHTQTRGKMALGPATRSTPPAWFTWPTNPCCSTCVSPGGTIFVAIMKDTVIRDKETVRIKSFWERPALSHIGKVATCDTSILFGHQGKLVYFHSTSALSCLGKQEKVA